MLKIPVSLGELVDKITILKIKLKFLSGQRKAHVKKEYDLLNNELRNSSIIIREDLIEDLQMTNQKLWELEDKIRVKELNNDFKEDFVELARTIYKLNDKRYAIKNKINKKYNSIIFEEKIYETRN
tara:strand:- start:141 stop:518 length:378 start_codon:yes stop_codon:yes gene_type:complete